MTTHKVATWTAVLLVLAAILSGVLGVTMAKDTEVLQLPGRMADVWRILILAQAGFAVGLMGRLSWGMLHLHIDTKDQLLRPLGLFALSYLLLVLDVTLQLVSLLGYRGITWKTPMAFFTFILTDVALFLLVVRAGPLIREAIKQKSTIRVTLVDTAKPGPDVDLSTGSALKPN